MNLFRISYIFCLYFNLHLHVWIRIQEALEYGSNTDPNPQHWYGVRKLCTTHEPGNGTGSTVAQSLHAIVTSSTVPVPYMLIHSFYEDSHLSLTI